MKKLHLLLAAILVLAQVPFAAFAAPMQSGPVLVPEALLHEISGGACTTCGSASDEPEEEDEDPVPVGRSYWEHTDTRIIGSSNPPGMLDFEYVNDTDRSVTRTVTITRTDSFSWSLGGGVPRGIVSASLGASYNNSYSDSTTVTISPRTIYQVYVSNPTTRYRYQFTQFQDWSDGTRQKVSSGTANGSHTNTSTRHTSTRIN